MPLMDIGQAVLSFFWQFLIKVAFLFFAPLSKHKTQSYLNYEKGASKVRAREFVKNPFKQKSVVDITLISYQLSVMPVLLVFVGQIKACWLLSGVMESMWRPDTIYPINGLFYGRLQDERC